MYFTSNMPNNTKERCLKASEVSGQKIEIREPSKNVGLDKDNYFGLFREDFDMSKFWTEYDKLA